MIETKGELIGYGSNYKAEGNISQAVRYIIQINGCQLYQNALQGYPRRAERQSNVPVERSFSYWLQMKAREYFKLKNET